MNIREGYMDFEGYQTYYRIAGECADGRKPLIILHGGPGSTHTSLEMLDPLAEDGRMLIYYDQIGCGLSPAPGRTDLFNRETWVRELQALRKELGLDEVHLLGHSWGGMLLLEYVCRYDPQGIKGIVLSNTLPSSWLWALEQRRMIEEMPEQMRAAIDEADRTGDYTTPAYEAANTEFTRRHGSPAWGPDAPECLTRPKNRGKEAYETAWGPNEFTASGNLKDYDVTDLLPSIKQPALVLSGGRDECTPYIAKVMYDSIPDAEWVLFRDSRHCTYGEATEEYLKTVSTWLAKHDA